MNLPPEVELRSDGIWVRCSKQQAAILQAIPGVRAERGMWKLPNTALDAWRLDKAFASHLTIPSAVSEEWERLIDVHDATLQSRHGSVTEEYPAIPRTRMDAWGHQNRMFWNAARHFGGIGEPNKPRTGWMFAAGMGCGKSKSTIDLFENLNFQKLLIVCPLKVVSVWPDEFQKHALREWMLLPLDDSYTVKDKAAAVLEAVERAGQLRRPLAVIVNYQSVWRVPLAGVLQNNLWSCLVLDESHRAKDASGAASRYLHKLSRRSMHALALSGTPFHHSILDIFGQFRVIDEKIYGPFVTPFKREYTIPSPIIDQMIIGYRNLDQLGEKFHSRATVVPRSVLGLPEPMHETRYFDLSPSARRIYNEFDKEFQAFVGSELATASNVLVKALRLRQMTGGWLKLDSGEYKRIDTGKEELLAELIDDIGSEPCVTFCQFEKDIEVVHKIYDAYGIECLEISGNRDDYQAWKSGKGVGLAVQMNAGAEGLDLTRARLGIYYSIGYSLGAFDQSMARIHRPGQKRICTLYHLLARGTVDPKVYAGIQSRRDLISCVMEVGRAAA